MSIKGLPHPWNHRLRSILVDSSGTLPSTWELHQQIESYGQIISCDEGIWCNPAVFKPFQGVELFPWEKKIHLINVPHDGFTVGEWVGFNKVEVFRINEESITLNAGCHSNLWVVSEQQLGFPMNFTNVFCGSFNGWERALQWLQAKSFFQIQRNIAIDFCEQTMKIWQLRTQAPVFDSAVAIRSGATLQTMGIQMEVSNDKWLNSTNVQTNHAFTASPPCQSWCKGGKHGGLASETGIAFIEFIQKTKQARPILVAVECADSTPQHGHFAVIRKCFEYVGYTYYWSAVVPYEQLSSMARTRWLAIWIRNDISIDGSRGVFRLIDVQKKGWNDDAFSFTVPDQIQHQLILRGDLTSIYGDFDLLPPSKKFVFGETKPSVDAVLQTRCIRDNQVLPTLVASYTQQHLLARTHLTTKGIFAYLMQVPQGVAFVDPFRFASLLGATTCEIVAIPIKTEYAFRGLGNAIAVPHAMLTILVGLNAIKFLGGNITSIVQECWNDKVTANNSIVIRNRDYAFIVPHSLSARAIADFCIQESKLVDVPHIIIGKIRFNFHPEETLGQFLNRCGIVNKSDVNFFCMQDVVQIPWKMPLKLLIGDEYTILHKYQTVFRFACVAKGSDDTCERDSLDDDISSIINQVEMNPVTLSMYDVTQPYDVDPVNDESIVDTPKHACVSVPPHETTIDFGLYDKIEWDHQRNRPTPKTDSFHEVFFTNGKPKICISAKESLTCDAISTRIPFFDPECKCKYEIQRVLGLTPASHAVFIASSSDEVIGTNVPTLIQDEGSETTIAKFVKRQDVPWNFVIGHFPNVANINLNGVCINQFNRTEFSRGDVISVTCRKRKADVLQNNLSSCFSEERATIFKRDGCSLASDELEWAIRNLQQSEVHCEYRPSCDIDGMISFLSQTVIGTEKKTTVCPILHEGHWCACEIHHGEFPQVFALNFLDHAKILFNEGLQQVGFSKCPITFAKSQVKEGFCGWVLLHRWCLNHRFLKTLQGVETLQQKTGLKAFEIIGPCPPSGSDVLVWSFAACIRLSFLQWHVHKSLSKSIRLGATQQADATMKPAASDPIFENDPWAPPKDKKMCKWEDLKMPNDHHFHYKNGDQITQLHRQQLNENATGIAFATKSHVATVFSSVTSQKIGLLIPASDKPFFDEVPKISITGPFEVVVQDAALGTIYKRQTLLIQHGDQIVFELPKPSYTANPPALTELVLEIDERMISKEVAGSLREKPLDFFKKRFIEQLPSISGKQLHIYAFRAIRAEHHNATHQIFQTMTKVTCDKRSQCIERSGIAELFIRDFIPKGSNLDDITTLPRFWVADRNGQADALKASSGVEGYAGLTLTRRGIAVRAWCTKLAPMRSAILADDDRVCKLNLATVPRVIFESTGWPATIGPSEVVKAVYHEVNAAPIPTRCFKILGVTTWCLAFDEKPAITRFLCQLNGASHEIILTPAQDRQPVAKPSKKAKGEGKGKTKTKQENQNRKIQPEIDDSNTESRLTALEVKFGSLERRQDTLESRITEGFGTVNDQLRQVLNVIQPRSATEHTGSTPPPKLQKVGN